MEKQNRSGLDAVIIQPYRFGALSYRANRDLLNPYQSKATAFQGWQEGYLNEQLCLHVVDGVDIISAGFEGPISLSLPTGLHVQPRKTYLAYAHALMLATGMYARAAPTLKKKPFITALQLRNALQAQGDVLSSEFASLIKERIKLDIRKSGAALTKEETLAVEQASAAARNLLLSIGWAQDSYYDRPVSNGVVAKLFKRSPEWTANMLLCSVRRNGLASSVQFNRQKCTLTPKGWSMAGLMREPGAKMAIERNDAYEGSDNADIENHAITM